MTNQQKQEALRPIQRYKIGYHADEWGQRSSTPSGIPDHAGSWVRYADHVAALVETQQPAPSAAEAEPIDSLGIPLSCGGPLCAPSNHHPYCKLAVSRPQADSQPAPDVDLIARGMRWEECESLMKEACAQAGVQWDEEKEPQSIAINVMQRLANAAHKVGFTLGKERMAAARAPDSVLEDAARWQYLRDERYVGLCVMFFGNGCTNITMADVIKTIDAKIAARAACK